MIQTTRKMLWMRFCVILAMISLIFTQPTQNAVASDTKPSLGNSMANQNLFRPLACEYEGKIYYAAGTEIYAINIDATDGSVTTTWICDMDDLRPEYLTVLGKNIYAIVVTSAMSSSGRLARIDPNSGHYKIYKGKKYNNIEKLCAAKGRLYYYKDGTVYSMKADGSARKTVIKRYVNLLAMNEKRIYYADSDGSYLSENNMIYSCDLNGKHVKKLYRSKSCYDILELIEDNGYIYFSSCDFYGANHSYDNLYRKKLSRHSTAKKIYSSRSAFDTRLLDVDKKYIYFVNKKRRLTRLNRKTGKTKKVIGGSVRGVQGIFDDLMIVEFWSGAHDGGFSGKLINRTTGEVIKTLYSGEVRGASG